MQGEKGQKKAADRNVRENYKVHTSWITYSWTRVCSGNSVFLRLHIVIQDRVYDISQIYFCSSFLRTLQDLYYTEKEAAHSHIDALNPTVCWEAVFLWQRPSKHNTSVNVKVRFHIIFSLFLSLCVRACFLSAPLTKELSAVQRTLHCKHA